MAPGGVGFLWVPCRVLDFAGDSVLIELHIYSFKHEINVHINLNKCLIFLTNRLWLCWNERSQNGGGRTVEFHWTYL